MVVHVIVRLRVKVILSRRRFRERLSHIRRQPSAYDREIPNRETHAKRSRVVEVKQVSVQFIVSHDLDPVVSLLRCGHTKTYIIGDACQIDDGNKYQTQLVCSSHRRYN